MTIASQYVRGRKVIVLLIEPVSGVKIIPPEAQIKTPKITSIGRVVTPTSVTANITSTYTVEVT